MTYDVGAPPDSGHGCEWFHRLECRIEGAARGYSIVRQKPHDASLQRVYEVFRVRGRQTVSQEQLNAFNKELPALLLLSFV
jgi:hypothetical protein